MNLLIAVSSNPGHLSGPWLTQAVAVACVVVLFVVKGRIDRRRDSRDD